jgi:hypothetical protein
LAFHNLSIFLLLASRPHAEFNHCDAKGYTALDFYYLVGKEKEKMGGKKKQASIARERTQLYTWGSARYALSSFLAFLSSLSSRPSPPCPIHPSCSVLPVLHFRPRSPCPPAFPVFPSFAFLPVSQFVSNFALGHGPTNFVKFPRLVRSLQNSEIKFVAVSQYQTMAITREGECYFWGKLCSRRNRGRGEVQQTLEEWEEEGNK